MRRAWIAAVVPVLVLAAGGFADAAPAGGTSKPAVQLQVDPKVQRSLQALAKLRQMGYRWTTDAGALKVIKAWQRANGLTVDGIVGPETLGSLGLDGSTPATATVPATRVNPPPPPPDPGPSRPAEGNVEAVIRDVWPDDLEDWAVAIATRESNLQPDVRNACCWGLFQIHWRAHRAWLISDFGITSPEQLYDPRTNATVALALYEQAGPGPWKL